MSDETWARLKDAVFEHLADESAATPGAWVLVSEVSRMGASPDEDEVSMTYAYEGGLFAALGLLAQAQRAVGNILEEDS